MSRLYIVPTPIGNLNDITLRALETLKSVDLILAEDTRTSSHLMKHFGISKPMQSYHIHNEHQTVEHVANRIERGENIALVSDAGTPSVSDPGFLLVRECIRRNIPVECLPGPSAFLVALINSGLPTDRFVFEGFLPQKKGRMSRIEQLREEHRTMIFYESPHRLLKALEQFISVFGEDRKASVSRELTKMFEENKRGTLKELHEYFSEKTIKGEIVLVVQGKQE
jgi:16S rRNA (cytidine1402-2'-O)-methyltransferase